MALHRLDILIYDGEEAFNAVKTALNLVKQCPTELLKTKSFRVAAFELALISTGIFKSNDYTDFDDDMPF